MSSVSSSEEQTQHVTSTDKAVINKIEIIVIIYLYSIFKLITLVPMMSKSLW